MFVACEQMKGRKKERKNRKIAESTLQRDEECSSDDAIGGVGATLIFHDAALGTGVPACMTRDAIDRRVRMWICGASGMDVRCRVGLALTDRTGTGRHRPL
jgi:hypothetical protein